MVDPGIAIDRYLDLACRHRFGIAHVVETHTHADHVSGNRRLAELTGAVMHVSAAADAEFASRPLRGGDSISVGSVELRARATPGHRPEHLSFVLRDRSRADAPLALLSGDALLVGDVGRPDLAVEPRQGAQALYGALRSLSDLDDSVELWPGHIGGSLCGGSSLSQKPSSTLGYERRANPYLAIRDEPSFVERLIGSLPPRPPRADRVVALNRASALPVVREPRVLGAAAVGRLLSAGGVVVDVRPADQFDAAHLAGAVNLPAALRFDRDARRLADRRGTAHRDAGRERRGGAPRPLDARRRGAVRSPRRRHERAPDMADRGPTGASGRADRPDRCGASIRGGRGDAARCARSERVGTPGDPRHATQPALATRPLGSPERSPRRSRLRLGSARSNRSQRPPRAPPPASPPRRRSYRRSPSCPDPRASSPLTQRSGPDPERCTQRCNTRA